MARLYEWEDYLTAQERADLDDATSMQTVYRGIIAEINRDRDGIRRKAVQRARNALNKELRRKAKEGGSDV